MNQSLGALLMALAVISFIVAALPHKLNVRFEWLGVAFLILALVVSR